MSLFSCAGLAAETLRQLLSERPDRSSPAVVIFGNPEPKETVVGLDYWQGNLAENLDHITTWEMETALGGRAIGAYCGAIAVHVITKPVDEVDRGSPLWRRPQDAVFSEGEAEEILIVAFDIAGHHHVIRILFSRRPNGEVILGTPDALDGCLQSEDLAEIGPGKVLISMMTEGDQHE